MENDIEKIGANFNRIFEEGLNHLNDYSLETEPINDIENDNFSKEWRYAYIKDKEKNNKQMIIYIFYLKEEEVNISEISEFKQLVVNKLKDDDILKDNYKSQFVFIISHQKYLFENEVNKKIHYSDEIYVSNTKTIESAKQINSDVCSKKTIYNIFYKYYLFDIESVFNNFKEDWVKNGIKMGLRELKSNSSNNEDDKIEDYWSDKFEESQWWKIYLIYDKKLSTGTLVFFHFNSNNGFSLVEETARKISWSYFKTISESDDENGLPKLDSLSYVLINDFAEPLNETYSNIIGEIDRKSELLYEISLDLIDIHSKDNDKIDIWETRILAHHLLPFRKNDSSKLKKNQKEENYQSLHKKIKKTVGMQSDKINEEGGKNINEIINEDEFFGANKKGINDIDYMFVGIKSFTEKPYILDLEKRFNLIYAPNGYGKSTIVDGLKKLFNQESFEKIGKGEVAPVYNIYKENSFGLFSIKYKNSNKNIISLIHKNANESKDLKKVKFNINDSEQFNEKDQDDIFSSEKKFNLFNYSNELNSYNKELLIELLTGININQLDDFHEKVKTRDEFDPRDGKMINEIKEEIETKVLNEINLFLKTLTSAITSDSWLYDIEYKFDVDKGIKAAVNKKEDENEEEYELDKILNAGEEKVVDVAIFFLLYYLKGKELSDIIIFDDVFNTFDERQAYNLLRLMDNFSKLEFMKNKQWMILSHWRTILEKFYYSYLKKDNNNDGYFNFHFKYKGDIDYIKKKYINMHKVLSKEIWEDQFKINNVNIISSVRERG